MSRPPFVQLAALLCLLALPATAAAQDRLSGEGESCTRTADCAAPLRCVAQICTTPAAAPAATDPAPSALPAAPADPGEPAPRGRGLLVAGAVTGGAGLLLALVGGVVYAFRDDQDKLDQISCTQPPPLCASFEERVALAAEAEDERERRTMASFALFGVGGAALITGVVLLSVWSNAAPDSAVTIAPMIDGRGDLGATVGMSF